MNSAILRSALHGHCENRISKELSSRLNARVFDHNWSYAFNKSPSAADLTDDSIIQVSIVWDGHKKLFEFRFTNRGDMRCREVTEWRLNP